MYFSSEVIVSGKHGFGVIELLVFFKVAAAGHHGFQSSKF